MTVDESRCADRLGGRTVYAPAGCDLDPPRLGLAGLTVKGPAIHFAEHGFAGPPIVTLRDEDLDGLTLMSNVGALVPRRAGRPTSERGHTRRRAMAVMALAAILLTGACSSSGDDEIVEPTTTGLSTAPGSTPADTTSTSSSPTSSNGDDSEPSAEAVDGYLKFWAARFEANKGTPNPDDPALAEFATGPQLENVVAETQGRLDAGHALREADPSQTRHDVAVVSFDGDRAELQDCFVNDGVVYEVDGGGVVDDSVVTRSVSAEMVLVAGEWKLERATVVQEWEGIAGCALAS